MKDFVFAPQVTFMSFKFMYERAFFFGTKDAFYVCPYFQDDQSTPNLIQGQPARDFLMKLANDPSTNVDTIHQIFAEAISVNNAAGSNNLAYIDVNELKRLRIDARFIGTSIVAGFSTNIVTGDRMLISGFKKPYKKMIGPFYKQFYPLSKILKVEEGFQ